MLTEDAQECFICDQQLLTIFFWNEKIGRLNKKKVTDQKVIGFVKDRLVERNQGHSHNQKGLPEICGQFTNWKYTKMVPLVDFCY